MIYWPTSGRIYDDKGNAMTVKYANVSVAQSQTDTALVAAVAGKRIRVISQHVQANGTAGAVQVNSKPAGVGTAKWGPFTNDAFCGSVLGLNPNGHYESNTAEGLSITTGVGGTTTVSISYVEFTP